MKQSLLSEALYQVAELIIEIIVVHATYVAVISPN
ncbi:MAG: MotA/TolQ/ExbB proton channel family protein, partial [Proteobacteria bacterium]|nr:MotA/TolQ/ExbB proton channel family protein [Pseudomonadota bacterium]